MFCGYISTPIALPYIMIVPLLQTAIVKTLQEVRDILPGLLDNGLKVYLQGLFTALSQDVRCA